jgi:hypothetical protein
MTYNIKSKSFMKLMGTIVRFLTPFHFHKELKVNMFEKFNETWSKFQSFIQQLRIFICLQPDYTLIMFPKSNYMGL